MYSQKYVRILKLSIALFFIVANGLIYGQNSMPEKPGNPFWLSFKLGTGYNSRSDPVGGLGISLQVKRSVISLRSLYMREVPIISFSEQEPKENSWDVGLLYGYNFIQAKNFSLSFSAGVSRTGGLKRGKFVSKASNGGMFADEYYEEKRYTTIGLPIELGFRIHTKETIGGEVSLFADINSKNTFGGITFSYQAGILK